MSKITEDAIDSLKILGCVNRSQAEQVLTTWARRDKLSAEQRRFVVNQFQMSRKPRGR